MTDLRKQDASAVKVWGKRLVKGAWKDHEVRTLEQFAHMSDYNLAQKLRRKPSSVQNKRMSLKREQDQISEPVITKRLRESRKAKQMEKLDVERRDAYVNKVLEYVPPLTGNKRAVVEKAFNVQSPFDSIKRTGKDGTEYWSARDLMPLLGYASWRRFEDAIDRARSAAEVQGYSAETLFAGAVKKTGGRPQQDFELARFAAYLIAMNGDPRKP